MGLENARFRPLQGVRQTPRPRKRRDQDPLPRVRKETFGCQRGVEEGERKMKQNPFVQKTEPKRPEWLDDPVIIVFLLYAVPLLGLAPLIALGIVLALK